MRKIKNTKDKLNIIILFALTNLFFWGVGKKGFVLQGDSSSYISLNETREPLYPLFLKCFRNLFGELLYLDVVWIVQTIFAIITILIFTLFISKMFKLNHFCSYIILFLTIIPYWIDTIWWDFALHTNQIATEGITISLYYLFVLFSFKVIIKKQLKYFIAPLTLCILLCYCRSQMIICIFFCLVILVYITWKTTKKNIFTGCFMFVIAMVLFQGGNKLYRYYLTSSFESSKKNQLTVVTNILFASDEEDVSLFKDNDIALFYEQIFQELILNNANYKFAKGKGLNFDGDLLHEKHDVIKYKIFLTVYQRYESKSDVFANRGELLSTDEILDVFFVTLYPDNFFQWLFNCLCQLPKGFMRTIFMSRNWICELFCVIAYAISIVAMLLNFKRNSKSIEAIFMSMILFLIVINVSGVSLAIFSIMRYLIYNMGLFYVGLFLNLRKLIVNSNFSYIKKLIG